MTEAANLNTPLGVDVGVLELDDGHWLVEGIDHGSEGEVYRAIFSACKAEERARAYAKMLAAQPAQTPGVGAWVVRSPNGNVRYWSRDEALTKRNAAKWGLEARYEALGPSPFRPSEGEVGDALSEVSKRIPDTILHGNSFGHEGFYPHVAVKTLVAAVYSGLSSSSSITATQPDRGVEGEDEVEDTIWPESPLATALFKHVQSEFSLYDDEAADVAGEIISILVKHGVDPTTLPPVTDKPADGGLREALVDLVSWFTKPVQGQNGMVWVIPAGEQGADDAVSAGRAALAAGESGE